MSVKLLFSEEYQMYYRPDTTDENVMKEIFGRKDYQNIKNGFVFDKGSQKGKRWLDLGANIGAFSKLVEKCGGTTIAFEPIEENFMILEKNVDKSEVFQAAVTTSKSETLQFYTSTKERDKYRFTSIQNARPSDVVNNIYIGEVIEGFGKFDGVKIDIEGAELDMIDKGLIPDCDLLVMEYHFSKDKNMANFHKRVALLREIFTHVHYQPFLNKYDLTKPYPLSVDKYIHCVK